MSTDTRTAHALTAIRIGVALLIFIHGAARVASGGVAPFGGCWRHKGFQ